MRSFVNKYGPWIIAVGVLANIAIGGVYLQRDHAATIQVELYSDRGNLDFPRLQLTEDPTNGRIASVSAPYEDMLVGQCSGALVGPDLVLTAAHCLEGHNPQGDFQIYLGLHLVAQGYTYVDKCTVVPLSVGTYKGTYQNGSDYALLQTTTCQMGDARPGLRHSWYQVSGAEVETGAPLTALGYPGDETYGSLWASPGAKIGVCQWRCNTHTYRVEMRISGGNSGGPVLLGDVESDTLVGVVSGVRSKGDSLIQKIEPHIVSEILAYNTAALS